MAESDETPEPRRRGPKKPKHPDDVPPSRGNGEKCDEEEHARRLRRTMELIVLGAGRRQIHQVASTEGWAMALRNIDAYMVKARKEINVVSAKRREDYISDRLARRDLIFATAMQNGELKTALDADDSFAKLLNLFPPTATRADVNVRQQQPVSPLTDEELEAILARSIDK